MERVFLLIIIMLSLIKANSQPLATDGNNKRILEWDSTYQIESKWFRADSFFERDYQCIVKRNGKTVAEYFRHDNESFLYVLYDSSGWIIQRGLLKYTDEKFNCEKVEIPDWSRDPDGRLNIIKDTVFCDGSYRKNGTWKETDSYGMIWMGRYKNGLREGEWKEGFLYKTDYHFPPLPRMHDYFSPYITHQFYNELEIPLYHNKKWQEITKQDWFYGYYQLKFDKRFLRLSSYKDDIKWHFLPDNKMEITEPVDSTRKKLNKSVFKYNIVDDRLVVDQIGIKQVFQLVRMDGSEIILKILDQYISEK